MITLHKTTPQCAIVYIANDPSRLHLADRVRGMGVSMHTLCLKRWTRRVKVHFAAKDDCQECRERQELLAELPAANDPSICCYEYPESRVGACDSVPCTVEAVVFGLRSAGQENEGPRCLKHFDHEDIVNVRKPVQGVCR